MKSSELKAKGIKAVFWNLLGSVMKQGSSFIISIFLARLLTPEDFGLVGMATVFTALTQSFADLGMSAGLIQKKNPTEMEYCTVFYINLALSSVLMITLICCSNLIARYYDNPEISPIIRFISYGFVINAVNGVQYAQLTKALANKVKNIATLYSTIATGVIGIALAIFDFGVWSLVYSSVFGSLVRTIYIWNYSKWRPKLLFDFAVAKPLLKFGSSFFFIGLLKEVYNKVDILIIGKFFSPATLGLFYKAKSLNQIVLRYGAESLMGVLFPLYSHIKDDIDRIRTVAEKVLHLNLFFTFALMGCLYVTAEDLIIVLFSDKWIDSIPYFKVLIFSSFGVAVTVVLFNIFGAIGKPRKLLKLETLLRVSSICVIPVGFLINGIYGYLWLLVLVNAIIVLVAFVSVDKELGWRWDKQLTILLTYALSSTLVVIFMIYIYMFDFEFRIINIIANSIVFLTIYFGLNYLLHSSGMILSISLLKQFILKQKQ